MKYLALAISLLYGGFSIAQENENLFEVEYELNGKQMNSFAYSVENCSQSLVHSMWQNWVLNKGGSFNILKKYEANNLQFKNSDDKYKVVFSVVEDGPNKLTLINTLIDQNGMPFSETNPDFKEIYEKLLDLSFQTRKGCVRNSLKVANETLIRLSTQNVDLQSKKGSAIKSSLKSYNDLLKLENKKALVAEKYELIENQLERATEDKKIETLMKKKNKTESSLTSLEIKVQDLTAKVATAEESSQALNTQIDVVTEQLQTQRTMTEALKSKFIGIER